MDADGATSEPTPAAPSEHVTENKRPREEGNEVISANETRKRAKTTVEGKCATEDPQLNDDARTSAETHEDGERKRENKQVADDIEASAKTSTEGETALEKTQLTVESRISEKTSTERESAPQTTQHAKESKISEKTDMEVRCVPENKPLAEENRASANTDAQVQCAKDTEQRADESNTSEKTRTECAHAGNLQPVSVNEDSGQFVSFEDAKDLGVTSTAPLFTSEKPWVLQGDSADGWWGHESAPWLYNETTDLYFHPPSKQLFRRPDPTSETVVAAVLNTEPAEKLDRVAGIVQWWNTRKNFGFLVTAAGGSDDRIFCHQKQIESDAERFRGLRVGDHVTFELAVVNDRICASAVRLDNKAQNEKGNAAVVDDEDDEDSGSVVEMDLVKELHCSYASAKGEFKEDNEDRFIRKIKLPILENDADLVFLGLMDGHNGSSCSEYLQLNWSKNMCQALEWGKKKFNKSSIKIPFALESSLELLDHNFLQNARKTGNFAGSTALGLAFFGPDEDGLLRLYTGHLGDSRAVLCRNGTAVQLTKDHKPDREDEAKRIRQAGGSVTTVDGVSRVVTRHKEAGIVGLAMSRALGDLPLKEPNVLVTSKAEVNGYNIDMDADEFVVMASDGIFDVLTDDRVVEFVRNAGTAEGLVQHAKNLGSHDDCTVIIIRFGWHADFVAPAEPSCQPSTAACANPATDAQRTLDRPQFLLEPRSNTRDSTDVADVVVPLSDSDNVDPDDEPPSSDE